MTTNTGLWAEPGFPQHGWVWRGGYLAETKHTAPIGLVVWERELPEPVICNVCQRARIKHVHIISHQDYIAGKELHVGSECCVQLVDDMFTPKERKKLLEKGADAYREACIAREKSRWEQFLLEQARERQADPRYVRQQRLASEARIRADWPGKFWKLSEAGTTWRLEACSCCVLVFQGADGSHWVIKDLLDRVGTGKDGYPVHRSYCDDYWRHASGHRAGYASARDAQLASVEGILWLTRKRNPIPDAPDLPAVPDDSTAENRETFRAVYACAQERGRAWGDYYAGYGSRPD